MRATHTYTRAHARRSSPPPLPHTQAYTYTDVSRWQPEQARRSRAAVRCGAIAPASRPSVMGARAPASAHARSCFRGALQAIDHVATHTDTHTRSHTHARTHTYTCTCTRTHKITHLGLKREHVQAMKPVMLEHFTLHPTQHLEHVYRAILQITQLVRHGFKYLPPCGLACILRLAFA